VGVEKGMTYNRCKDNPYSFKQKYLKELSSYPDTKIEARVFLGARIGYLKKQLKNETRPRYIKVLKELIAIYEKAK
jgi:hypothetical protein